MSYFQDSDNFAKSNGLSRDPYSEPTGFAENFSTMMDQTIREDLSISTFMHNEGWRHRNEALNQAVVNGDMREDVFDSFRVESDGIMDYDKVNYEAMAIYMQDRGMDIKTDVELKNEMQFDLDEQRAASEEVYSKAGFAGTAGMFAGGFTGYMVDPITWPAMFIGGAAVARGATVLGKIAWGAGTAAGIGMAEEAAIQPFVYKFKREKLGVDYDVSDAMETIFFTGAVAGTLGAVGASLAVLIKRARSKNNITPDEALELIRLEQEVAFIKAHPNADKIPAAEVYKATQAAVNNMDEPKIYNGLDGETADTYGFDVEDAAKVDEQFDIAIEGFEDAEMPSKFSVVDNKMVVEFGNVKQIVTDATDTRQRYEAFRKCLDG